jgi:hypothetical protein
MKKSPKAAIVTTLRDANLVIDSFIKYHLSIGFDCIFLFFDDPNDVSIKTAEKYPNVIVIRNDDALHRMWEKTRLYGQDKLIRRFIDTEVMARQELNVEIAIGLALEKRIDWLLHLDIDELFYCPTLTVTQHFQTISDRDVRRISYLNYEAIPERSDIEDFFKEVVLFKKSPLALSGGWFNNTQLELVKAMPELPNRFFLFYGNGKSAARVNESLWPDGVHSFRPADKTEKPEISTDPLILHYPCCGFEHFWRKYKTLGHFPEKWFDEIDIAESGNTFHLEARDVVSRNDRSAAKDFYEKRIVMSDKARIRNLIESDLCCLIYEPSKLLSAC